MGKSKDIIEEKLQLLRKNILNTKIWNWSIYNIDLSFDQLPDKIRKAIIKKLDDEDLRIYFLKDMPEFFEEIIKTYNINVRYPGPHGIAVGKKYED